MAKDYRVAVLLDYYGEILTEKQRTLVDLYYNEDMSLAEIAGEEGITRQGVRDGIKRAELQLFEMEDKLHLYERRTAQNELAVKIAGLSEKIINLSDRDDVKKLARQIGNAAAKIG